MEIKTKLEPMGGFKKVASSSVAKFVTSFSTSFYKTKDGDLYMCGYNAYGQQGKGSAGNVTRFTQRASNVDYVINSGGTVTFYMDVNGNVYGCGDNAYGQQGNDTTNNQLTFENKMQYFS